MAGPKRYAVAAIVALGISLAPGELRTSREAQIKIATWEECRARPYRDLVGSVRSDADPPVTWKTACTHRRKWPGGGSTICAALRTASHRISGGSRCRSLHSKP